MMRLRFLTILFPAVLLVACQSTLTPQQQVYQLQRQLDVALEEIEIYAEQPPCDPTAGVVVACHDMRAVLAAIKASEEADDALDQAEAVVRAGGTHQDIAIYVNLARAALARVAAELAKEGSQ